MGTAVPPNINFTKMRAGQIVLVWLNAHVHLITHSYFSRDIHHSIQQRGSGRRYMRVVIKLWSEYLVILSGRLRPVTTNWFGWQHVLWNAFKRDRYDKIIQIERHGSKTPLSPQSS